MAPNDGNGNVGAAPVNASSSVQRSSTVNICHSSKSSIREGITNVTLDTVTRRGSHLF